jgi:hypothetical protein
VKYLLTGLVVLLVLIAYFLIPYLLVVDAWEIDDTLADPGG